MKYISAALGLTTYLIANISFASSQCAYSENLIKPLIEVTITRNKDESYRYHYKLTNSSSGKSNIRFFFIEKLSEPLSIQSPPTFKHGAWGESSKNYIKWARKSAEGITVGKSQSGFIINSKLPPGIIKAKIKGAKEHGYKVKKFSDYTVIEKHFCPGFWLEGSSALNDSYISVLTIGPISSSRISPELRIKKENSNAWSGGLKHEQETDAIVSPVEKGIVELLLVGSSSFDVDSLDPKSISFGRGNAKPISSKVISDLNGATDPTLAEDLNKGTKNLYMKFNIAEINVLCELDRALFLEAKTKNGDQIFTGVKIDPTFCTPENFAKEIDKMRGLQVH